MISGLTRTRSFCVRAVGAKRTNRNYNLQKVFMFASCLRNENISSRFSCSHLFQNELFIVSFASQAGMNKR